jgi:SAM-dependent methyltransferase
MSVREFDQYSDVYHQQHAKSIDFSGFETDYFAHYKIDLVKSYCDRIGLSPKSIMDFGAGIGASVPPLRAHFPDSAISCVDVSQDSLDHCSALGIPNSSIHLYDGKQLPFADGSFDLIFTACVFHHIPEQHHVALLSEIRRCLSPNGVFLLFEHNPINPLTQLAVARCPFDENAVLIGGSEMQRRMSKAGFSGTSKGYRIFFPAFLRPLVKLEKWLDKLPLGGQYYVAAKP